MPGEKRSVLRGEGVSGLGYLKAPTFASPPVSAAARSTMLANRGRDTVPELAIRSRVHRAGLRYRVDAPLPGMPRRRADVLVTRAKIAVFVDGCFWHGCPEHKTSPANNAAWWTTKLARNVERDRETDAHLVALGWRVLRVWEHEDMKQAAKRIVEILRPDLAQELDADTDPPPRT